MYNIPNYGYYYYDTPDMFESVGEATLGGIFIAVVLAALFFLAVSLVCYIIKGISLYTLAKRRGIKNAFFAFIPVLNMYLVGNIADDICATMNRKTKYAQKILILYIISLGISFVTFPISIICALITSFTGTAVILSVIMCLLGAASAVVSIGCDVYVYISLYRIYNEYAPRYSVVFEVLSIIFPVTQPFFLLYIRNKKSGYEIWLEQREAESCANSVKFEEEDSHTPVEEVFGEQQPVDIDEITEPTIIETAEPDSENSSEQ